MRQMYKREIRRSGHYKLSPSQEFYAVLAILALFSLLGAISFKSLDLRDVSANINFSMTSSAILDYLLIPVVFYLALKVSLKVRWALIGVYILIASYLIVDSFKESPKYEQIRQILFLMFVSFEGSVLIIYLFGAVLIPKIILYLSHDDPDIYQDRQQLKFSYEGEVNSHDLPHGFGTWRAEWGTGLFISFNF